MKNTLIEWAHHTVNFWWGCVEVSEACRNCYARTINKVFGRGRAAWGKNGVRWFIKGSQKDAISIARRAAKAGVRQRVFVNSMSDSFEDHEGLAGERERMLLLIELLPSVDWLLLTKRPENVRRMVPARWLWSWPAHVWIGTTVEDQNTYDTRVRELVGIPAAVRFLSMEPLLGWVNLDLRSHVFSFPIHVGLRGARFKPEDLPFHWVIAGGESGSDARPSHPDWFRSLRDQCKAFGIDFFFKQWGQWKPSAAVPVRGKYTGGGVFLKPDGKLGCQGDWWNCLAAAMDRVKKKKDAGRLLDGVEHNAVPEVRP